MNTEGTRADYKFFLREKSSLQSRVIPKPRKLLVLLGDKVAPGLPDTHAGLLLNLIIKRVSIERIEVVLCQAPDPHEASAAVVTVCSVSFCGLSHTLNPDKHRD